MARTILLFLFILFLPKISTFFHNFPCCPALIISLPCSVLASEHRLGASLILGKLEVVVNTQSSSPA